MDEEDASDHTRRCLARALAEVGRPPDPERARALDRLRQDFVGLRGSMLASRLDPASAQRRVRELGGAAEGLLRDLTGETGGKGQL
ncbi:hypothetical protein DAETH_25020 [Deinococcus aetherius]|uniref:Uncharacterized protein n=1 Tax=Deinococcus aetherius TaxID=200252 RepID=A0ABN6RKJ0_9DEIO|nr:hypothetical protein [Deinococcus aetherius]BDP42533.1 hypothetical protein DAETH_25020 [Deinococcus aetherius]